MKKVLFTAKVDSHILHFHVPMLKLLKKKGYEIHVASEGDETIPFVDYKYNIKFGNNPFSKSVVNSYKELGNIMKNNTFDIVHTHTAVASVLTRFIAKKNNVRKIVYTAHGFHFFSGGSLKDWILYFPIEYIMSFYTSDLILINQQDYTLAKKFFHSNEIHYIPGVGVSDIFYNEDFNTKPDNVLISSNRRYITYIAELNNNKNQKLALEAFSEVIKQIKDVDLLLVGSGVNHQQYKDLIKELDIENNVQMLGYCKNVREILHISSLAISTSRREGLAVNIMESMAVGLPIVACKTRGVTELVDEDGGILTSFDKVELSNAIIKIMSNSCLSEKMSRYNRIKAQNFRIENVTQQIEKVYEIGE